MEGADQVRFASCLPLVAVRLLFFRKGGDPERYFPAPSADSQFPLEASKHQSSGGGTCSSRGCWKWSWEVATAGRAGIFPAFHEGFISRLAPKLWRLLAAWTGAATAPGMWDLPAQRVRPPPFNPTP